MKVGIQFPRRQVLPTREKIQAWVETTQIAGVDYIMMGDHVLGVAPEQQKEGWDRNWPVPKGVLTRYTHKDPWQEVFVALSFISALTDVELATGVLVLPQRGTALVAKQAAQLDLLCNGKLRLGVGVGWNAGEFEAMGAEFADRGQRFREQIDLMRRFWTDDIVNFTGKFHTVCGAGLAPLPVQQPIPVWIGGADLTNGVDAVAPQLRRIGEVSDGWILGADCQPGDSSRAAVALIRKAALDCGRDPDAVGLDARLPALQLDRAGIGEHAAIWSKIGATHLTIDFSLGPDIPEEPLTGLQLRDLVHTARDMAAKAKR